jgi:hypothetical protein
VTLAAASAALEAGDRLRALDALLAAWRAQRSPAIADAIDLVSAGPLEGVRFETSGFDITLSRAGASAASGSRSSSSATRPICSCAPSALRRLSAVVVA